MNLKKKILALLGSVVLIVGSVSVYYYVEKSVTKIESTEKESHKKTSKDKTSDSSTNSNSKKNTTSNSKTSLNKSNNESTNTTENRSEILENQETADTEVASEASAELLSEPIMTEPESVPIPEENVIPEEEYAPVPDTSYSPSEYVGTYTITAYTWTGNVMANGEYPYVGCVASCDFPLGTTIYIDGVGTFVVNDVCPTSGVIDVYMNSYDECINFGCFQANVSIVY